MTPPLLLLLFGRARALSRSVEALKSDYEAVLARGGGAGGYAPRPLGPADSSSEQRAHQMEHHALAVGEFAKALARWQTGALDRMRLPHPLLGKLTVREMIHFTLLHNVHHVAVAERRRRQGASSLQVHKARAEQSQQG